MSDIVVYNNGELELNVSVEQDTIWLTQKQIVELFDKNQSVISRHITNIFNDGEVDKKSNMQKMHNAFSDKPINLYSLDIILAVGYRTNSSKAIKFRQWATTVLKNYITNGYTINAEKITNERFVSLENDVITLKQNMDKVLDTIQTKPQITQKIFFNGQIFDAYTFISDLLRTAKKEIILIDNYVDDTTLTFFSKIPNIKVTIYTHTISKQLKLDLAKYNKQYNNITLKIFKDSHDRFLIIDDNELYHIGASLKDAGNKWFAFSKMDISLKNKMISKI